MQPTKIEKNEFALIRDYIEKHCGIRVGEDKTYLIETRLTTLMAESGCINFTQFYHKALADTTNALRDKIVDAMTTNETLWFRDGGPYEILRTELLPAFAEQIRNGSRQKLRIWSAACSTGQEPYSIAMVIQEFCRTQTTLRPEQVEIVATDISPSVLFMAKLGRYDSIAMNRGMTDTIRERYFEQQERVWVLRESIRKMVNFRLFNLQESFAPLGRFDIVFIRNVLIYFADEFKRSVLHRCAERLQPAGILFLGASESMINFTTDFEMLRHANGLYYRVRAGGTL
jgi:chemotaxis protein methyltransferase CheR